jgi:hypothetical protein
MKKIAMLVLAMALLVPTLCLADVYTDSLAFNQENMILADYANGCPSGFPLNCHNGRCCPEGHTFWCGGQERPCINPAIKTDEEMRWYVINCQPLLRCTY